MLSALSLENRKDVNQLSIPHLATNTYFYPCLGQQFFKKNMHSLLQVLDFVCQSISYSIYQKRSLLSAGLQAGCHQRGKHPETPRHALCPDQHGSSWSALLQILDLYQASIKATQSIKALIGEHGLAVDLIQV